MTQTTISNETALVDQTIKLVINAWASQNKVVTNFFNKYTDEVYLTEVAPGRNRAIYLLGHLIAINDFMLPMFGLGEKLYPQLEAPFIKTPDKLLSEIPSLPELKSYWETLNVTLTDHFNAMQAKDWLAKHSAVSAEDFLLNPQRNKLNVLISRTNHQSYHIGQLNLSNIH